MTFLSQAFDILPGQDPKVRIVTKMSHSGGARWLEPSQLKRVGKKRGASTLFSFCRTFGWFVIHGRIMQSHVEQGFAPRSA